VGGLQKQHRACGPWKEVPSKLEDSIGLERKTYSAIEQIEGI
jgi:hypothetical protein